MTIVMLLLMYLPDRPVTNPTLSSNSAAWIAVLLDREQRQGRDAWSFQELSEARAAVFDAQYAVPKLPGWVHVTYLWYLQWYPALLLVVMSYGLWLTWIICRSRSWTHSLLFMIGWLIVLWLILLPTQVDARPAAVIKMHGITLRQGNGLSYPYALRQNEMVSLAAGVEAQVLAERSNGWVQLMLSDGARGWVPRDAVYLVGWNTNEPGR